jgi:hypothetical protein
VFMHVRLFVLARSASWPTAKVCRVHRSKAFSVAQSRHGL